MNEVERIYEDLVRIGGIVIASADASTISAYGEHSAKTLLLAGASYFERRIVGAVQVYVANSTSTAAVAHFAYHQAIERKFFSFFNFSSEAKNINSFLAKFGPDFSGWAKDDLPKHGIDGAAQLAFIDFCRLRNSLAHNNYATFDIGKTLTEVKEAFDASSEIVSWVETAFSKFEAEGRPAQDEVDG